MRLSWRAWPSSLFVRMALILLLGLLVAQGLSFWLQWGERATVVSQARGQNFADRMAEVVRALEATAPAERSAALATLPYGDWQVTLISENQVSQNPPRGPVGAMLSARLGSAREVRPLGGAAGMGMGMMHGNMPRGFDVRLQGGQWLRFSGARQLDTPALPRDLILRLAVTLMIVTAVVMLAVRQATQPLKQLAQAADTLGRDLDAPALAEEGPTETRRAAQAFNRMQARIKRLVNERSRALAAVSHDLRTPLTRLRLRAELVDDETLRDQMAADLDAMAAMIDATLDYLRGLQTSEAVRPIDINALLASMSEDALVLGRRISIQGQALAPYTGRLSALRRALQNLIDNAIKYGTCAHLRVDDDAGELRIMVEDEGPGIEPHELARVTEPYYRPDASRSSATGGVGLGLSIAKDIALLHGGDLVLTNRAQGGLCATLKLPRVAAAAA
ncbi:ATP-binding protein [Rhodoferax ferrireducens]|uniref:ATP-binding protein n=1 Tax=Rhodoferax ferrireducens TaxID=192843 RepID=UPI003BB726F0